MNAPPLPTLPAQKRLIPDGLNQNNFDVLRFLLAACVIYSHCFVIYYGQMKDTETLRTLTHNQADFGGIAVDFFFAISGFLIVRSFEYSRSLYEYFTKRILRIVPGFAVAFIVSVFLFGVLGTASAAHPLGKWQGYLSNLNLKRITWQLFTLEAPKGARTFASNPLPNQINESLWTIQYEFLCYMLVPLFGMVAIAKRRGAALVFFLAAYIVFILQLLKVVVLYDNEWRWVLLYPSELPRLFAFFFAGACAYHYRHWLVRSRYLLFFAVASLVIGALWAPLLRMALPVAGTYLLFYVAYHSRIRFHDFARRGDFSYGLYLYGWPIQQLMMYLLAKHLNAHLLFLISFPLVLLAAYASWHLVEKPFLKLKSKLKKQAFVNPKRAVSA